MPRFIAIPVGQGDAFYLEREDFSVLIDGGRSQSSLPSMFKAVTKRDGVNVIVCTHNDADHANGVLSFLRDGLRYEEIWLPSRWLSSFPDILRPFVEVFDELAKDIAETDSSSNMEKPHSTLSPIEAYAERVHGLVTDAPATEQGLSVGEDGWPESYRQLLEQAEPWEDLAPHRLAPWDPEQWPLWPHSDYLHLGPAGVQLLWSTINAASRIRAIATEAFHSGIPVRWFEFDPTTASGGVSVPQTINARSVARVCPRIGPFLKWLALTVSNRESLVFWSPPAKQHPGVLFTADSDLAGVRLPSQLDQAIVTAPHHGSETNVNAYKAVVVAAQNNFPSITWVRSDGKSSKRPGRTYLGLAPRRLCTLCRHAEGGSIPKQAVRLYSRAGKWVRHRTTRVCSCQ